MKWSWRIGTIAGIGVYLHGTFLILLAWIVLVHFLNGNDWQDTIGGLLFVACLFGIIVLHELGHALTAGATASVHGTSRSCRSAAWPAWRGCRTIPRRSCWWRWPAPR